MYVKFNHWVLDYCQTSLTVVPKFFTSKEMERIFHLGFGPDNLSERFFGLKDWIGLIFQLELDLVFLVPIAIGKVSLVFPEFGIFLWFLVLDFGPDSYREGLSI